VGTEDEAIVLPEGLPALSRSAFWVVLWALSTSTARRVSLMLRPLPFFGAVKVGPVLAWDLVHLTCKLPAPRSISSHLRPRSSPILKPAVTAST
jgi:hypothetical protein